MRLSNLHKLFDADIRTKNITALRLAMRELWWSCRRPPAAPPVFVVGCSRSGTTVTYETLAASPQLTSLGFEIPQFWNGFVGPHNNHWHSEAAGAEDARPEFRKRFLQYCFARLGTGRVLDKTCINVLRVPFLASLFPDASFVYIYRDGRDNISSMIDGWRDGRFALTQFLGAFPQPVAIENGEFDQWHFFLPPAWRDYNRATLARACAHQWISANSLALEGAAMVDPERWISIRYEDLFDRPVELFRDVYAKLDLEFSQEIERRCRTLDNKPTSIVTGPPARSKWKDRNPVAVDSVLSVIAPLMAELQYTMD